MRNRVGILLAGFALSFPAAVHATETITYTYDAKGRLIRVVHTGTVNNGVVKTYDHDKADNRKTVTTTGSPNNSPPS